MMVRKLFNSRATAGEMCRSRSDFAIGACPAKPESSGETILLKMESKDDDIAASRSNQRATFSTAVESGFPRKQTRASLPCCPDFSINGTGHSKNRTEA